MSNNKQSSVEWLIDRIEDVDLTPQIWEKIKQQAKAMHKEEIDNLPIHIHEGIENIWVYIEDGIVHVKPNPKTNEQTS